MSTTPPRLPPIVALADETPQQRLRRVIRIRLAEKGWSQRHLAIAVGTDEVELSLVLNGQVNRRLRRRVETFFQTHLWATEAEFNAANHAYQVLGVDPITSNHPLLLRQAQALGVVHPDASASREEIIELAALHPISAVRPDPPKQRSTPECQSPLGSLIQVPAETQSAVQTGLAEMRAGFAATVAAAQREIATARALGAEPLPPKKRGRPPRRSPAASPDLPALATANL